MIKKSAEIEKKVVANLKDGIGEVAMINFISEKEAHGAGRLFGKILIEPGNSIGQHTHEGETEAYYILKGKALVSDNGNEVTLEAGDCHICPDGNFHSVKNVGDDTLEFIAVILFTKQKEV